MFLLPGRNHCFRYATQLWELKVGFCFVLFGFFCVFFFWGGRLDVADVLDVLILHRVLQNLPFALSNPPFCIQYNVSKTQVRYRSGSETGQKCEVTKCTAFKSGGGEDHYFMRLNGFQTASATQKWGLNATKQESN